MEITRVTEDLWQRYRDVRLMALADAPYAFGSTLAKELSYDEARWRERSSAPATYIATVAGHDVGLVSLWLHPEHFPVALVTQMWVDPAARGHGVATSLMAALVDRARELGVTRLVLHVTVGNERAESLYRGLGWVPTGNRGLLDPDDPSRGEEIEMARDI